jgi:hypothetical protein
LHHFFANRLGKTRPDGQYAAGMAYFFWAGVNRKLGSEISHVHRFEQQNNQCPGGTKVVTELSVHTNAVPSTLEPFPGNKIQCFRNPIGSKTVGTNQKKSQEKPGFLYVD